MFEYISEYIIEILLVTGTLVGFILGAFLNYYFSRKNSIKEKKWEAQGEVIDALFDYRGYLSRILWSVLQLQEGSTADEIGRNIKHQMEKESNLDFSKFEETLENEKWIMIMQTLQEAESGLTDAQRKMGKARAKLLHYSEGEKIADRLEKVYSKKIREFEQVLQKSYNDPSVLIEDEEYREKLKKEIEELIKELDKLERLHFEKVH